MGDTVVPAALWLERIGLVPPAAVALATLRAETGLSNQDLVNIALQALADRDDLHKLRLPQ